MAQSSIDQLLPSKELATITALAQGYSDYKKRLEEKEMASQKQRAELLKIILPKFLQQQGERAQWERERPLEMGKLQLEQRKATQAYNIDFERLQFDYDKLAQTWNLAQQESASAAERANIKNAITVQLKGLDVKIAEFQQAGANLRQAMQGDVAVQTTGMEVTGRKDVSAAQVTGRAADVSAQITGRADVAKTTTAATKARVEFIFGEKSKLLKERHEFRLKEIAAAKKAETATTFTRDKIDILQGLQNTIPAWLEAVAINPEFAPFYNNMVANMEALTDNINVDIVAEGGTPMPSSGFTPVTTVEGKDWWWGPIPRIFGAKPTIEKAVPAVVPGLTPARGGAAETGLAVQGPPAPMELPELKTSGTEFQRFVNMMVENKWIKLSGSDRQKLIEQGIDPDAIERAANKARQ